MLPRSLLIIAAIIISLIPRIVYADAEGNIRVLVSILFVDSDGDGLGDDMEKDIYRTDPFDDDSDNDGYTDGAEVRYEGSPLDPDAIPTKGELRVTSTPAGAEIFLDGNYGYPGRFAGYTAADRDIVITGVRTGIHVLRLSYPGYEVSYNVVNVIPPKRLDDATAASPVLAPLAIPYYDRPVNLMTGPSPLDAGGAAVPFVVDWDNDGRKDLIAGNSSGDLMFYKNYGSDNSPVFAEGIAVIGSENYMSPFVVDWDNDGNKDILTGTEGGDVLVFRNTGSESVPSFEGGGSRLLTLAGGYARPFAADWNGDRKKDIVTGDGSGAINVFLNTGTDGSPLFDSPPLSLLSQEGGRISSFVITDWDGDARMDVIAGTSDGLILLYLNQGGGTLFGSPSPLKAGTGDAEHDIEAGPYASPFVVDWNGDGVKDLLIGNGNGEVLYYGNHAPEASFITPQIIKEGEQALFDGGSSSDPDGDPLSCYWDFGDGSSAHDEEWVIHHSFPDDGVYTITLTATDQYGESHSVSREINVINAAPTAYAGHNQRVLAGDRVYFSGEYSDAGIKDTHSVSWDFGDGTTAAGELSPAHVYNTSGVYTVTLTVTDGSGESGYDQTLVRVDESATVRPLALSYPYNDKVYSASYINLDGMLNIPAEGVVLIINGSGVSINSDNSFTGMTYLAPGINNITISLKDKDGYTYTERMQINRSGGDINGDGIVGLDDALKVLQISSGIETAESLGLDAATIDVAPLLKDDSGNIVINPDGTVISAPDGIINVADSLILLRAAIGDIILPVLPLR